MSNKEIQIKKVCNLYVNDWHFTTTILPHINNQITAKKKVITILENGIKDKIEEILSKMNLKEETNEKILQINWTSNKTCKYEKIEKQIEKEEKQIEKEEKEIEIIISGTKEYIENANKVVEKLISKTNLSKITIINCYELTKYQTIDEIVNSYEYILNTSGIEKTSEKFKLKSEENKNVI